MFNCPLEPTNIGKLFIINKFIEGIGLSGIVNKKNYLVKISSLKEESDSVNK